MKWALLKLLTIWAQKVNFNGEFKIIFSSGHGRLCFWAQSIGMDLNWAFLFSIFLPNFKISFIIF